MKRVYLLPNLITTFSLACGLFVIFKTSLLTPDTPCYPVLLASTILLAMAGVADLLDGAMARLVRAESDFGKIFDSLSDGITFGVAPAVLALKSLTLGVESEVSILVILSAMLFTICGVLRLVRYSVAAPKAKRHSAMQSLRERARSRVFIGLPIPAAACGIVSATLFLASPWAQAHFTLIEEARGLILATVMVLLGYLMVSRWKFPGLKTLNVRLWSYNLIFLTVVAAIIAFYGILHYFPLVFGLGSWTYLTFGFTYSLTRALRRSKETKAPITEEEHINSQR